MTPRGKWIISCAIAYLLLGAVVTLLTGGCFCEAVSRRNLEAGALYQEFLKASPPTLSGLKLLEPLDKKLIPNTDVVSFDAAVVASTNQQVAELWISPFSRGGDAVEVRLMSERSARVYYHTEKPANIPGQPVRVIFINECWPRLRLPEELKAIEASGGYGFLICPAEPPDHNKTVTIYGFGAWAKYAAKIENPYDFPAINRSRAKRAVQSLNYLWAFPLDIIVSPVAYSFVIWMFWRSKGS